MISDEQTRESEVCFSGMVGVGNSGSCWRACGTRRVCCGKLHTFTLMFLFRRHLLAAVVSTLSVCIPSGIRLAKHNHVRGPESDTKDLFKPVTKWEMNCCVVRCLANDMIYLPNPCQLLCSRMCLGRFLSFWHSNDECKANINSISLAYVSWDVRFMI